MTIHDQIQHWELQEAIVEHCAAMRQFIQAMREEKTELALAIAEQALQEILSVSILHCEENGWWEFVERLRSEE